MKAICDRGALLESLSVVGGVILSRTPKPALTCVKITAAAATLTLAATDMEVSVRVSTPRVEVQEEGEALVPADKLGSIVRESNDPTLAISTDQDAIQVRTQDSRFKVLGYAVTEFPAIPDFPGEPDYTIAAGDLCKLIAQTVFATARENSRYAINGVLLERQGSKLAVVATDGRRLAMAKGSCKPSKADAEASTSAIVPTKALHLLLKLFTVPEKIVRVKVADNQIHFGSDEATMSSALVEGNFPPYKDVIPRDADKKATLATPVFASATRRSSLLTNEESKGVKLSFDGKGLTISSRSPEMGESEVKAELVSYNGEPIDIGFNPFFILDCLKVVDAEQVSIEFKAPNKPGIIRTGPDFLYVIMPVSLQ